MSPDVNNPALRALTYDELATAYQEQMEALLEGGVDALLIETIFDSLNAKAAIYAAETAMKKTGREVPLMLSVTGFGYCRTVTLSGQTLDAFSGIRTARAYFFYRSELLIRSETIETFFGRAGRTRTLLYKCLSQCRTSQQFGTV